MLMDCWKLPFDDTVEGIDVAPEKGELRREVTHFPHQVTHAPITEILRVASQKSRGNVVQSLEVLEVKGQGT